MLDTWFSDFSETFFPVAVQCKVLQCHCGLVHCQTFHQPLHSCACLKRSSMFFIRVIGAVLCPKYEMLIFKKAISCSYIITSKGHLCLCWSVPGLAIFPLQFLYCLSRQAQTDLDVVSRLKEHFSCGQFVTQTFWISCVRQSLSAFVVENEAVALKSKC